MTYERVTFLFSLPRSGTQWLTWLYGHAITAWHDPLKNCASIRELKEKVDAVEGRLFIADTSAVLFHDQIVEAFPGAQRLYLYRPVGEVMKSITDNDGVYSPEVLYAMHGQMEGFSFYGYGVWVFSDLHRFAHHYWYEITGDSGQLDKTWELWCMHKIDKPLREQYRLVNTAKARRLFAQREIAR
jgi:hypothetical protein